MWQTISVRETCERLKTNSVNGLTKDEAEDRLKKYGENKVTEKKNESILELCVFICFVSISVFCFFDIFSIFCSCFICCDVICGRF